MLYRLLPRFLEKRLRAYRGDEEIGVNHYVELRCPNTDDTIGTEGTEAVHIKRDVEGGTGIWTYKCEVSDCPDELHSYLWGPPAPIRVHTPDEARRRV